MERCIAEALGATIIRPDYLLVRRRVVGALRERLGRAEQELLRRGLRITDSPFASDLESGSAGLASRDGRREVFPWPWPLLEQVRQWLGSYLAHLHRASSHRLLGDLRRRFAWLDEYFVWERAGVRFRCSVPRRALRFAQQKAWFLDHLPGHVLMVQEGPFCERITDGVSAETRNGSRALAAIEAWPRRFPRRRLPSLVRLLWNGDLPVAWIGETGRRPSSIAERALVRRWPRPGRELYLPGSHASEKSQDEGSAVPGR